MCFDEENTVIEFIGAMIEGLEIQMAIDQSAIPDGFEFNQNYPNPFNANMMIQFTIPNDSHVELTIYNFCGQKVATIINNHINAGKHSVKWKAEAVSIFIDYPLEM